MQDEVKRPLGESDCLSCGKRLAYCGAPFTADIRCPNCGAVNVFEESQQPKYLRGIDNAGNLEMANHPQQGRRVPITNRPK